MQANVNVIHTQGRGIQTDGARIRAWMEKVFTRERLAVITLAAANGAVVGGILLALQRAVQIPTYTGGGFSVFGGF